MADAQPAVYLARHGETAWSLSGQHTGLTDLPLTERGIAHAHMLGARLRRYSFEKVYTSPLQRAHHTCTLAGFGERAEIDPDLVEWNYGDYEGKKNAEIQQLAPGWVLFRDGVPNGESVAEVTARADRVIGRLRAHAGNVLLFSSGHFLRCLAARWVGLPLLHARNFLLSTSSLSILSYDHNRDEPAIKLWNDTSHLDVHLV